MDYFKFNCYDLASQNTELYSIYNKMRNFSNELNGVFVSLDSQIKRYESLHNQFVMTQTVIDDIIARIYKSYNALDQIIDVYYAAENKALQEAEQLPTGLDRKESLTKLSPTKATKISPATINSQDLVLEDWLAELVYRYGSEDNNNQ